MSSQLDAVLSPGIILNDPAAVAAADGWILPKADFPG